MQSEVKVSKIQGQIGKIATPDISLKINAGTHDVMKSVGRILESKFEELDTNFARSMEMAEMKVCKKHKQFGATIRTIHISFRRNDSWSKSCSKKWSISGNNLRCRASHRLHHNVRSLFQKVK